MLETDADRSWQAGHGNREPAYDFFSDEMYKEDPTQGIPDWSQPFAVNLGDLEMYVLAHSSEREISDSEGDASKLVIQKWKHSIHTNFRKYRKRSIPWTEEIGDLKTVERKSDSRNDHQLAPVVQNLTIQWILPARNKNFTGDGEESTKVSRAVTEAKRCFFGQFMGNSASPVKNIMESSNIHSFSIRNKRNCRTSYTTSKRGNISRIVAIWIGWKVVVRFDEMLLLFAECPKPLDRREISIWTKIWWIIQRTN